MSSMPHSLFKMRKVFVPPDKEGWYDNLKHKNKKSAKLRESI